MATTTVKMTKEKKETLWKARPFMRGDEKALADLYETVLQRPFEDSKWGWQFGEAASGVGYIGLADHDGRLAGQYATVPVRMQIQGKKTPTSLSLDTMTHPDYRKQGIFITLAKKVYEQSEAQGVKFVYGFPNDNSFPGFVKYLDFFVLEDLPAMTRPLSMAGILKHTAKVGFLSTIIGVPLQAIFNLVTHKRVKDANIRVEMASEFPKEVSALFEKIAPRFRNLIIRDYDYLSWRYDNNPSHSYDIYLGYRGNELSGYCVCGATERKNVSIGLIVDLFADPDDDDLVASLAQKALEVMAKGGTMTASCVLTSKSPFLKTLRRMGFVFPMRRFPFIIRPNSSPADASSVNNVSDWHITLGDGDLV